MKHYFFALFFFISCASGGFPTARTVFRDVRAYDSLVKSYTFITETWKFQQEYELSGIIIGSRHQDIIAPDQPSITDVENITIHLVEHNGTYGAPRKLVGVGNYDDIQTYNSSIYIPLVDVKEGTESPIVKPISVDHTLYYLEIDNHSPVPGLYPYFNTRELDYFGAVTPETVGNGIVVGIKYSKP